MKKVWLFTLFMSCLSVSFAQTPYTFTRYDSIVVKFNTDTFDLAWAGGINFAQFSNIDLNFDGYQDLYVFDRTGNKSLCFLYTGHGGDVSYRYAPEYESYFPGMVNWCLLKDYNCDGLPDIFTSTPGGIMVYKNTSSPGHLEFTLFNPLIKSWQLGNWVNLYVSSVDLPGLGDIDEDGDLDILTFGVFGTELEYHRNYSAENGYGCDSMQFTMRNQCWGCFQEDPLSNGIYLGDTCSNNGIPNPDLAAIIQEATDNDALAARDPSRSANRHSGSCTTILDVDGNKMKDLVMGDVSFDNEVLVVNGGNQFNMNQCMDSVDTYFPSYDVPISVKLFPCVYLADVDNDGKNDMIVTPQGVSLSEDKRSVLYYHNQGQDSLPDYNFVQRDLLQYEMIEKGEGAFPVLTDYNGDGLLDLIVADYGAFNSTNDTYLSQLSLYVNVGTATQPVFNLITENFASLDIQIGLGGLFPAFADMDNDGDRDMIVGNENGTLSYFNNTAGAGNPYNFTLVTAGMTDVNSTVMDVGSFSVPMIIDIDRDNDFDLVVGNKTGKLSYYVNMGTNVTPVFKFITDYLGQVNVKQWWDNNGYSAPTYIDSAGNYQFFIGSKSGFIHHYNNIDGNLTGTFTRVDSTVFEIPEGIRSTCALADLNNDGAMDIITGNYRGGLTFFYGDSLGTSGINEIKDFSLQIYPNPASDNITIVSDKYLNNAGLTIYNMMGEIVMTKKLIGNQVNVDISNMSAGLYFITINDRGKSRTTKFLKYENR